MAQFQFISLLPSPSTSLIGTDRSFAVIPPDKIQLIQGDDGGVISDSALHAGGFHIIEIAPGVQQLELINHNNNNDEGAGMVHENETVVEAHRALLNMRPGEDPGGGGDGGSGLSGHLDSGGCVLVEKSKKR